MVEMYYLHFYVEKDNCMRLFCHGYKDIMLSTVSIVSS